MGKTKKKNVTTKCSRKCRNITLWFLLFFSAFLIAENNGAKLNGNGIEFEHISIKEGLSQGSVNCILQDNKGFMWFGTQNGLNRYDGHEFKSYTFNPGNPSSICNNLVISLYKDQQGILWIGTYGGLNKYDPQTEKFTSHKNDPVNFGILENKNVWAIGEDNTGILWVGTDAGLFKSNREKTSFAIYPNQPGESISKVRSIYKDQQGILWVGDDSGLYRYKTDTGNFHHYQIPADNPFYNEVDAIAEDQSGTLWIGTVAGVYTFHRNDGKFSLYPGELQGKQINVIFEDNMGIIWIGTRTDGLARLDTQKGQVSIHKNNPGVFTSLSQNNVSAIYQDNSGLLWIGTAGVCINRIDPNGKKFAAFKNKPGDPESLNNNEIRGICQEKDGIIWIGTNGSGINKFDPVTKTFEHYLIGKEVNENPRRNNVNCIFLDRENKLWVGTIRAGLYTFEPGEKKFEHYKKEPITPNESILEIYEDNNQRLWIGTMDDGLIVLDQNRVKLKHYINRSNETNNLSNNKVYAVFQDNPGYLWIGTGGGGLNKLDLNNDKFIYFQPDTSNPDSISISHNFISAIYRDTKGTLWIGTAGGLNRLISEKDKSFRVYTTKDGLPDNAIYDILEDNNGNLWISTNRGLSRFNPQNEEFRNYSVNDGLQGYEFNRRSSCKTQKGMMIFGGFNGFNVFNPGEIQDIFTQPPIVITSFKKLNQEVELDTSISEIKELNLSYRDSFISFGFAALSFSEPGNNRYAYKLEPTNPDWIYLGNKHDVDFTNLKPGSYTLKVKGANSHGVWNEQGTGLKINVSSPFWVTWWFITLASLIVIGGIKGFIKLRTQKMEIQNQKLEEQVKKRTEQLHQQKEELEEANIHLKKEIEERKHAEAALKESKEWYRTLVETSPDAIVLSDIRDGKIIMANPQSASLCGYTDVKEIYIYEKTIFELMDEKSRELALKNAETIKKVGINRSTEYNLLARDGTPISVEISTSLIRDAEGNPQYFLSIIRDIRKRKEAEQQEKLQRERFTQVDKMVTLGTLVSGVAHELNNPAASIKMNSEIFARVWKDVAPALEEYYKKNNEFSMADIPYADAKSRLEDLILGSMEGAQRIEKIIKDLKDYSRPGDPSTQEYIHINKVIQSSVNLTNNSIKKSTKKFSLELGDDLPVIWGNFQKLEQVFINLIQNACQALPDTSKGITISSAYNKEKKQVVIRVKDEGKGIEEKDLKHITDPFFTTKRDQGGTGLGLSICLQIIRDHGGAMEFDSQVGKGTTVTVCLPMTGGPGSQ